MAKRGRPQLTDEQAALEAAKVIDVAFALRYRPAQLARLGFASEGAAFRFVSKRYRGRTGEFVGNSVRDLFPAENRMQLAVSLVLDHGFTWYRASKMTGVHPTNLKRALKDGFWERIESVRRRAEMKTVITDAL
jgi:hypothetical protein